MVMAMRKKMVQVPLSSGAAKSSSLNALRRAKRSLEWARSSNIPTMVAEFSARNVWMSNWKSEIRWWARRWTRRLSVWQRQRAWSRSSHITHSRRQRRSVPCRPKGSSNNSSHYFTRRCRVSSQRKRSQTPMPTYIRTWSLVMKTHRLSFAEWNNNYSCQVARKQWVVFKTGSMARRFCSWCTSDQLLVQLR